MRLHDTIMMGFPEGSRSMPELTRIYHQYRSDLSIVERVILYQDRIVIPPSLRDQVLETLPMCNAHERNGENIGLLARNHDPDPRATQQLSIMPQHRSQQPQAAPTPSPDPVYPFQMICRNYLCYGGHNNYYLVIVD